MPTKTELRKIIRQNLDMMRTTAQRCRLHHMSTAELECVMNLTGAKLSIVPDPYTWIDPFD